jgi:UDP-glucose 4-epimerase
VGTSIETDVNAIFQQINQQMGKNVPEQHGPAQEGEQLRSVITFEKIKEHLGWEPLVRLSEGLKKTIDYFYL